MARFGTISDLIEMMKEIKKGLEWKLEWAPELHWMTLYVSNGRRWYVGWSMACMYGEDWRDCKKFIEKSTGRKMNTR